MVPCVDINMASAKPAFRHLIFVLNVELQSLTFAFWKPRFNLDMNVGVGPQTLLFCFWLHILNTNFSFAYSGRDLILQSHYLYQ
jgi:hypothetical protein